MTAFTFTIFLDFKIRAILFCLFFTERFIVKAAHLTKVKVPGNLVVYITNRYEHTIGQL